MPTTVAEITVAAIALHNGRFLCIEEQVRGRRVITQPAGHVEPGEALLDAVRREALEESGYCFEPEAVSGIYLWQQPHSGAMVLRVNFVGRAHSFDPRRPLDDGILRSMWMSREQLVARQKDLRNPLVLRGASDCLAGKRYPLDIVQSMSATWQATELAG